MARQVAVRLIVVCGFALAVFACDDVNRSQTSTGASGQPAASGSPQAASEPQPSSQPQSGSQPQSSSQPQSGAQVAEAGKDAGKGIAGASKSFGKAVADLGKGVVSGSGDKTKEAASKTGDAAAGLGKTVASGSTSVAKETAGTGTDAGITAAVNTRLKAEMPGDATKISALTNDGVVTLKGSVSTSDARAKAEQIAKNTSGVKSVVNQLEVK